MPRFFALLAMAAPLAAHSLYFMPFKFRVAQGETLVFSIHSGDGFPQGDEAPSPRGLADARLVTPSGSVPIGDLRPLGRATHGVVKVDAKGTLWLAVATTPKLLVLAPEKFEKYLSEEGLEQAAAWRKEHGETTEPGRERYTKFAKSLVVSEASSEDWGRPLGFAIEFLPESDPAALQAGGALPVRLMLHGKPASGVKVEAATEGSIATVGRTDSGGRITVPIGKAGRWRISGVAIERTSGDADWQSFWASLTFEVRQGPRR